MTRDFKTPEDFLLGMKKSLEMEEFLNKVMNGFCDARLLTITYSFEKKPEETHCLEVRHNGRKFVLRTGTVGGEGYAANSKTDSEECLGAIAYALPTFIEYIQAEGATVLDMTILGD